MRRAGRSAGRRRVDRARRSTRRSARAGGGASFANTRRRSTCRSPTTPARSSVVRWPRSTPTCGATIATRTARTSLTKLELAMTVTDADRRGGPGERERYREQLRALTAGVDLLLTPTLLDGRAARGAGRRRRSATTSCSSPIPSTRSARPRSRCRAAPPRTGCPRRSSSSAAPGDDGLVLAAGALLERALASA